ncbi:hypothetical protein ACH5RR_013131 [Cinchona calisaya]|uniref:Uncharacterized protein n=1 Tax=Cinchona calisaya TaxID=153742 RepID=A0ABD2ZZ64_9GENT
MRCSEPKLSELKSPFGSAIMWLDRGPRLHCLYLNISAIPDPQISIEPRVHSQKEEEAQTDTKKRKASSSHDHVERIVHEVNVPKITEFSRRDGVQTPTVLVKSRKDDDDVVEIPNYARKGKKPMESTSYSSNHFIPNWLISIED